MANNIKYRIGVGVYGDDINVAIPIIPTIPFTAASTDIFADSTTRTANETN